MDKVGGLWYFPLENWTFVPGAGAHRAQTGAWESLKRGSGCMGKDVGTTEKMLAGLE